MTEREIVVAIWHDDTETMTEHKFTVKSNYGYLEDGFYDDVFLTARKLGLDADNIEDHYPPHYAEDSSLR